MKNVVLLTIDALRKDAVSLFGAQNELTPFVGSLESNCIRFAKAQASGPYTQASFPGILASSYYLGYGKPKGFSPKWTPVSEVLQEAGIVTAGFHSNPYLCDFLGWNRGWDVFYDSMEEDVDPKFPYIKGSAINKKVEEWLRAHVANSDYRPFFLWLHYMDIHEPYVPEKRYLDLVDASVDLTVEEMFELYQEVLLKRDVSNEEDVKLLRKLYCAHVREVDDYTRNFFEILEKCRLLEDTILLLTSDHGDEFNEHGGLSHDDKMYSELIDVPLVIYDPSRIKGELCNHVVSNVDIPPTIVHLFGLERVKGFEGYSLLPLEDYPEKGCFGEAIDQKSQKGGAIDKDVYFCREGDVRIIYRANPDTWEMYDLTNDPKELTNIIDKSNEAERLKEKLKTRVRRWEKKEA